MFFKVTKPNFKQNFPLLRETDKAFFLTSQQHSNLIQTKNIQHGQFIFKENRFLYREISDRTPKSSITRRKPKQGIPQPKLQYSHNNYSTMIF